MLIRHCFGVPSLGIAALLALSLSACAGGAGSATTPAASTPQRAQRSSPKSITPYWPIVVTESFNPTSFDGQGGGTSHLTITFTSNKFDPFNYMPVAFTDYLPTNLVVAGGETGALTNTCGGQTSVGSTYTTFAIKNGTLYQAGASCQMTFLISGHMAGTYANIIPAGAVTAPNAEQSTAAVADVKVLPPHIIPKP